MDNNSPFRMDVCAELDLGTPTMDFGIDLSTPNMDVDLAHYFPNHLDHDFLVDHSDLLVLTMEVDQIGGLFGTPVLPKPVPLISTDESEAGNPLRIHNDNVEVKDNTDTPCGKYEKITNPGKENILPVGNRYQPRILRKPEVKKCSKLSRQCQVTPKASAITSSVLNGQKTVSQLVQGQSNLSFVTPLDTKLPTNPGFDVTPTVIRSRAKEQPTFLQTPKSSNGGDQLVPRRLFSRIRT